MSGEEDLVVRRPSSRSRAELAALELWDLGATAVEERDAEERPAEGGEEAVVLVASFPTPAAARAVAAELGLEVEAVPLGWRDEWKRHAVAVEAGPAIVVAPAWRPVTVAGDRLLLEIDPGPCFGSGSHPSTRLILQLLAERPPAGLTVLDVGTGSGILAVAAARLGATRVVAVDIDPDAVAVTRANSRRNGVEDQVEVSTTDIGGVAEIADLALVNVTAGVHAELGAAVAARVRAGGQLLLAGLLPGQWRHVAGAYPGCEVTARPELDGWAGAVLHKT